MNLQNEPKKSILNKLFKNSNKIGSVNSNGQSIG